jgi:fumarate reductase iron-sulfur subunit
MDQSQDAGAAMSDESSRLKVDIWRGAASGHFVRYEVPRGANQTVLDVVSWVQRRLDPSLAYRFACRVGVCGSCAMTVNGRPRWTCRTHVDRVARSDRLKIAPLRNLPILRDLVADMAPFFEKWQAAGGRFAGTRGRDEAPEAVPPDSAPRRAADAGIECINCAVCYAACDVVGWDAAYLGPAALNRAWTLANDRRHAGGRGLLADVSRDGGVFTCHSHGACAAHCPVGIDPTRSITGLKRAAVAGRLPAARGS